MRHNFIIASAIFALFVSPSRAAHAVPCEGRVQIVERWARGNVPEPGQCGELVRKLDDWLGDLRQGCVELTRRMERAAADVIQGSADRQGQERIDHRVQEDFDRTYEQAEVYWFPENRTAVGWG